MKDYDVVRMDSVSQPWPVGSGDATAIVTSPPYFGRRSYGEDGAELGSDQPLEQYVQSIVACFREAWRCLAPTGVAWLNIGDSAAKSGGSGGDYNEGGRKAGQKKYKPGDTGLRGPQYALVPWRVAMALQADGWLIRQPIVWDKTPVVRPEDPAHVRRPLEAYEMIFMLAKQSGNRFARTGCTELGNVWHFAPQTERRVDSKGNAHPAPFPAELPMRCLKATGIKKGELVVDPFHGSGTTGDVAVKLGLRYVGMDLYVGRAS